MKIIEELINTSMEDTVLVICLASKCEGKLISKYIQVYTNTQMREIIIPNLQSYYVTSKPGFR